MAQRGQFGEIGDNAVADKSVEPDGEGHETRDTRYGLWRCMMATLYHALTHFGAATAAHDVELAVDRDPFALLDSPARRMLRTTS